MEGASQRGGHLANEGSAPGGLDTSEAQPGAASAVYTSQTGKGCQHGRWPGALLDGRQTGANEKG